MENGVEENINYMYNGWKELIGYFYKEKVWINEESLWI